jgi:hypothetical protein
MHFRGEVIPNLKTTESMKYLGEAIAARRTVRLKSPKFKFKEMEILLGKIMSSPLLTVQKTDVVKIFLLLLTDFLLLNGEVGRSQLQVIDKKIRGMINREVTTKGCQSNAITHLRRMEIYPTKVCEKYCVLTIRSFTQMTLSDGLEGPAATR